MIAKVYVSFRPGVLDPQGKAVLKSAHALGYDSVLDVRQGKYFEVKLHESISIQKAEELMNELSEKLLANPVIENYRIELEER